MSNNLKPALRFPLLFLGVMSLIVGVLAGIGRLGIEVPEMVLGQLAYHGVLMVAAFFGTVIGLERAVAIGQRWAYLAPLLTGLGGATLLAGVVPAIAMTLITTGNVIFVFVSLRVLAVQFATYNLILLTGAIALLIGDGLLINTLSVDMALYWWMAFLLLTIAGERLELSRLAIRDRIRRVLLAVLSMIPMLGAMGGLAIDVHLGSLLFAFGMAAIAIWLLKFDVARRTVLQTGLTRFTAVCMLTGYSWLLLAALLLTAYLFNWPFGTRDAALHSFFLGFVFSMVLGHALIIFPAVTRLRIPWSAAFYLPFVILQISLLMRVGAGMTQQFSLMRTGALLNAVALALFVLFLIGQVVRTNIFNRRKPDVARKLTE